MKNPNRDLVALFAISTLVIATLCGCNDRGDRAPIDDLVFVDSDSGCLQVTLVVDEALTDLGTIVANTAVYNGRIPGPILRANPGDRIKVHLVNQLTSNLDPGPPPHDFNATNIHFHGLHVDPDVDLTTGGTADDVFVEVAPGMTHDYDFIIPADHPGGFFWYHPHFHENVARQVVGGLAGGIVIRGPIDQVPAIAQARERFLVLTDTTLDPVTGEVPALSDLFAVGNLILHTVNGLVQPVIDMRPGEVQRWRIVAASHVRFYDLQLDGHQLHQIGLDGIPFANRVAQDHILVIPGGRIEVLVKAGSPGTYALKALASGSFTAVDEVTLATVVIGGPPLPQVLPNALVSVPAPPIDPGSLAQTFELTFAPTGVNFAPFDPSVNLALPVLNTTEDWLITDAGIGVEHPFHIHTNPFQVVEINGVAVPEANRVWQDTALVPAFTGLGTGQIRIRMKFADFLGRAVFHCHILQHEDEGMMGAFEIVP